MIKRSILLGMIILPLLSACYEQGLGLGGLYNPWAAPEPLKPEELRYCTYWGPAGATQTYFRSNTPTMNACTHALRACMKDHPYGGCRPGNVYKVPRRSNPFGY